MVYENSLFYMKTTNTFKVTHTTSREVTFLWWVCDFPVTGLLDMLAFGHPKVPLGKLWYLRLAQAARLPSNPLWYAPTNLRERRENLCCVSWKFNSIISKVLSVPPASVWACRVVMTAWTWERVDFSLHCESHPASPSRHDLDITISINYTTLCTTGLKSALLP